MSLGLSDEQIDILIPYLWYQPPRIDKSSIRTIADAASKHTAREIVEWLKSKELTQSIIEPPFVKTSGEVDILSTIRLKLEEKLKAQGL